MKTAQNEAITPTSATKLSPSKVFLKSNKVMLKTISARAKNINIVVKIFMK